MNEYNNFDISELNNTYVENNSIVLNNGSVSNQYSSPQKDINLKVTKKVAIPRSTPIINLVVKLIVAVAAVAVVQPTILPTIFSAFVGRQTQTQELLPTYSFGKVTSTHKSISCAVTIDNVNDFSEADYSLIVVENGNETQEYISSIPLKYIDTYKTKVNSKTVAVNFSYHLTKTGTRNFSKNTDYCIVLLNGNKIIKTQAAKTQDFSYITNVETKQNTDLTKKYLLVQITANPEFTNFNSIYFQYTNVTTGTIVEDYSIIYKSDLGESWSSIAFNITDPVCEYQLKLFCSTDSPSELEGESLANTITKDEIKYYYIHTYGGIVI